MKIPTPLTIDLSAPLPLSIASSHATPGVYALHMAGNPPHLSSTQNLARRLARVLSANAGGSGPLARIREHLSAVECWPTASRLETSLLLYELTRRYYPGDYAARLKLRMPWFVGLTPNDAFPRLRVMNRVGWKSGSIFGPFASRDLAQRYEQEVLGLFQLRRCTEILAPDAGHPGCIYGEMSQCLRPCQRAVTEDEYATEAARVAEFLTTNGRSTVSVLTEARDRASRETDFEQAAQIHRRLEKVNQAASARDSVVTSVQDMKGIALTRGQGARQVCLWPLIQSCWQEPVRLDVPAEDARNKSLDQQIRDCLSAACASPDLRRKPVEDLAIFSRWYFSSWRDGQWFPYRTIADLNYRRMVREISTVMKGSETALEGL